MISAIVSNILGRILNIPDWYATFPRIILIKGKLSNVWTIKTPINKTNPNKKLDFVLRKLLIYVPRRPTRRHKFIEIIIVPRT
jgi:hypothetical protein